MPWDAHAYDHAFGYVTANGTSLVDVLDPQPGERILDLGCGTGGVTADIAGRGARNGPGLRPTDDRCCPDCATRNRVPARRRHAFDAGGGYDAVFSNAALHWMTEPDAVIGRVRRALRSGGRFVAEMGAAGNVATIISAVRAAREEYGFGTEPYFPWYFPTVAQQAIRLESAGFEVRLLQRFPRPTALSRCPDGAADWVRMFGADLLTGVPENLIDKLLERVNELTAPALVRDGTWWLPDYMRLRFVAVR